MDLHRPAQDVHDRLARVERAVGILEDELDLLARLLHARRREGQQILVPEPDLSRRGLDQPRHQPRRSRFAAAALADQAQGLAAADLEVDAVDRLQHLRLLARELGIDVGVQREVLGEPFDFEQRVRRRSWRHAPCRWHAA